MWVLEQFYVYLIGGGFFPNKLLSTNVVIFQGNEQDSAYFRQACNPY